MRAMLTSSYQFYTERVHVGKILLNQLLRQRGQGEETHPYLSPAYEILPSYASVLSMLDTFYRLCAVTVTNRDTAVLCYPESYYKSLFRKHNRLMRKGRIEKAESITTRISQSIVDHAKVTFSPCSRGSKELWEKVRQVTGKNSSRSCLNHVTVDELNQHFAAISTDQHYTPPLYKATVNVPSPCSSFTEYRLSHAGPNQIHFAWS